MIPEAINKIFLGFQPATLLAVSLLDDFAINIATTREMLEITEEHKQKNPETLLLWAIVQLRLARRPIADKSVYQQLQKPYGDYLQALDLYLSKDYVASFSKLLELVKKNQLEDYAIHLLTECIQQFQYKERNIDIERVLLRTLQKNGAWSGIDFLVASGRLLKHDPAVVQLFEAHSADVVLNCPQLIELSKNRLFTECLRYEPVSNSLWEKGVSTMVRSVVNLTTFDLAELDPLIDSICMTLLVNQSAQLSKGELLAVNATRDRSTLTEYERDVVSLILGEVREISSLAAVTKRRLTNSAELIEMLSVHSRGASYHYAEISTVSRADTKIYQQYMESPYPVWISNKLTDLPTSIRSVRESLGLPKGTELNHPERILIAGCGTGQQALFASSLYPDALVTAIDISCNSIGYADVMLKRNKIKNCYFATRDLNQPLDFGRIFDYVECGGVLHHLINPARSLGYLANVLKSDGLMRLAVYSSTAREPIYALKQELAITPQKFEETWRDVREYIKTSETYFEFFSQCRDFYSKNAFRDLVFNEREISYSLAELEDLLKQKGLMIVKINRPRRADLLGIKEVPSSVAEWIELENKYPTLFMQMYDLFVCKQSGRTS